MKKVFLLFMFASKVVFSQEEATFLIYFNNEPAHNVIQILEKKYAVNISFADKYLEGKTVTIAAKKRSLKDVLTILSVTLKIKFKFISEKYIIINDVQEIEEEKIQLKEVIIHSYLTSGISKNKDASFTIKPKKLDILPGLTEADILESILELPGVLSPDETATGLHVRGGTPDQNHIIWDGITIYHSGHLFGMISPFNPYITNTITFYNKGTNPRYGDRISSIIDISTNDTVVEETHVGFGFNAISVDANIETPLIKNKLSLLASFRTSYEGVFETNTFHKFEDKVFQNTKIEDHSVSTENFLFKDYNFKLNYRPNKKNAFSISTIHIDNDLDHVYTDLNYTYSNQNILDTENDGYSLHWEKIWTDKILQTTKINHSKYHLNYDFISGTNSSGFSNYDKENFINETNFSTEFSIETKRNNLIDLGYQYSSKNVKYTYTEIKDQSLLLDKDDSTINSHTIFGNFSNKNFNLFNFDIGLRATYFSKLNTFRLEPRLLILKNINANLKLQFTGEIRNQIVGQIEETILNDLSLEKNLWKLSNGQEAPIIHNSQISAGFLYHKNNWSLDVDTYVKNTTGITALSLGFLQGKEDDKFRNGKQKVYGTDIYIKKDFKKIKTWVSYSFIDIKNKYDGINNNNYFSASNQIKHALSASVTYKVENLQIGLGWKWHSGKPYTKAYKDANNNIVFDEINTENLSNYHRLDISSVYNFSFAKNSSLKGKIGFSIRNIYNQENHIAREYFVDKISNNPILVQDRYSIDFVPNFLFRINW